MSQQKRWVRFSHGIVRTPGRSLASGLTSAHLGTPIYEKALVQHAAYIQALRLCGLEVIVLDADEEYPDSTFVEDTALLTPHCAVLANPGAPSRKGEVDTVRPVVQQYFDTIELIQPPGTLEPGDVMMVGSHYYIGLSSRTDIDGARQLITILEKYGMTGSIIKLGKMLHLKTGVSYLEHHKFVACGELVLHPDFQKFDIIKIDDDEAYAANCMWINGTVLVAKGFPKAKQRIEAAGFKTIVLDMSEFQKMDGGLSCLSLRF